MCGGAWDDPSEDSILWGFTTSLKEKRVQQTYRRKKVEMVVVGEGESNGKAPKPQRFQGGRASRSLGKGPAKRKTER